jgi:hypothetical protein
MCHVEVVEGIREAIRAIEGGYNSLSLERE